MRDQRLKSVMFKKIMLGSDQLDVFLSVTDDNLVISSLHLLCRVSIPRVVLIVRVAVLQSVGVAVFPHGAHAGATVLATRLSSFGGAGIDFSNMTTLNNVNLPTYLKINYQYISKQF